MDNNDIDNLTSGFSGLSTRPPITKNTMEMSLLLHMFKTTKDDNEPNNYTSVWFQVHRTCDLDTVRAKCKRNVKEFWWKEYGNIKFGLITFKHSVYKNTVANYFGPDCNLILRNRIKGQQVICNGVIQSKTRVEDGYSSDDMSFELAMLANGTGNGNKQNSKEYKLTPKDRLLKEAELLGSTESALAFIDERAPSWAVSSWEKLRTYFERKFYKNPARQFSPDSFKIPMIPPSELKGLAFFLCGPANCGKSSYAESHFKNPLVINSPEQFKSAYDPERHDGLVIDEIDLSVLTSSAVLQMTEMKADAAIRVRFFMITIPREIPRIFTTNLDLPKLIPTFGHIYSKNGWVDAQVPALNRRIGIISFFGLNGTIYHDDGSASRQNTPIFGIEKNSVFTRGARWMAKVLNHGVDGPPTLLPFSSDFRSFSETVECKYFDGQGSLRSGIYQVIPSISADGRELFLTLYAGGISMNSIVITSKDALTTRKSEPDTLEWNGICRLQKLETKIREKILTDYHNLKH